MFNDPIFHQGGHPAGVQRRSARITYSASTKVIDATEFTTVTTSLMRETAVRTCVNSIISMSVWVGGGSMGLDNLQFMLSIHFCITLERIGGSI